MSTEKLRTLWKKATPFVFAAAILGSAGTALAHRYAAGDCCSQGAACCKPGAACCNGKHKIAQR